MRCATNSIGLLRRRGVSDGGACLMAGPPLDGAGAVWQVELRGVAAGDGCDVGLDVDGPDWLGWAGGVRQSVADRPGGHGAIISGPAYLGERTITVPYLVRASTTAAALDAVAMLAAAWAPADNDVTLVVRTPWGALSYQGRPDRFAASSAHAITRGVIRPVGRFLVTDPAAYALEPPVTVGLGGTTGGLAFPHGFPHGFGSAVASTVDAVNQGTWQSAPVLVFAGGSGGLAGPRAEWDGGQIAFDIAISNGWYLVVDCAARTVMLSRSADDVSAGASRAGTMVRPGSSWPVVPPGGMSYRFGGVGAGTLTVRSRSAWLL